MVVGGDKEASQNLLKMEPPPQKHNASLWRLNVLIVLAAESGRKREGSHVTSEVNTTVINDIKNSLLWIQQDTWVAWVVSIRRCDAGGVPPASEGVASELQSVLMGSNWSHVIYRQADASCDALLLLRACVCLFSSQLAFVLLAFSCYVQEAAFRMANGFPDRTPPPNHTHTHHSSTGRQWEDSQRSMKRL